MAYTPSGSITFNTNLSASVAAGTQVLNTYTIPVNQSPIQAANYSTAGGSGALACNRMLQFSGTLTTSAASSAIVNLAGGSVTPDVGGSTATWSHVREVIVFNDGNTATWATSDTNIIQWDFSTTVTTAWGMGGSTTGPIEGTATATTPKLDIQAGSYQRFSKPVGTTGWSVGTSTYSIVLATSGNSNVVNYRIIVMGD